MNLSIPLIIYAGTDFSTSYTFTYDDNSYVDLTGCDVCAELRKFETSESFTSFTIDYQDRELGYINLQLSSTQTAELTQGRYYYDILIFDSDGSVIKVVSGQALVKKSVS